MANHVSTLRKQRAQESIKRKIAILEGYVIGGLKQDAFVPRNLTEFRLWENSEANLMKLGSPNTLDQPHNRQLKLRAKELIAEIQKKRARKENRSNEIANLRAQVRQKDRLITELTNQWHSARHERSMTQQNERRLKKRINELLRDNGALTRKLKTVVPLRVAD